jgi:hypothetical protein
MITYLFIKYLLLHIKYCKILNNVYKNENLLNNLTALFKVQFRKDWVGRIYAIFNPHIQEGIFNPNNQIYEYTDKGLVNDAYVEAYILNQLNIAKQFIKANNLFDLLTYRLEKIDDNDNYLFIIEPITWEDCKKYAERIGLLYTIIGILSGFLIYFYIN